MEEIIEKCYEASNKITKLSPRDISNMIKILKDELEKRIDIVEKAYHIENEETFDKNFFLGEIKNEEFKYGKIGETVKNEYGIINNTYAPYGIVALIYDGNIYTTISIIVKSIQTRNALILCANEQLGLIYMLLEEIKRIIGQVGLEDLIQIYNEKEEILKNRQIQKIYYMGVREEYERAKIDCKSEMKYLGYMKYELYVEDEIDKELLEKISKIKKVKIYRNMELYEAINKINEEGGRYSVGIMTKSSESARKFIDRIDATNIFVNVSPAVTRMLNIECEELIHRKNVVIYE